MAVKSRAEITLTGVTDLEGIEIGGRNLLIGSGFEDIAQTSERFIDNTYTKFKNNSIKLVADNASGTSMKYVTIPSLKQSWDLSDVLGKTITISMWIYIENVGDLWGYEFRIIYTTGGETKWQNPDTRYPYYIPSAGNLSAGWNYVYGSFTVPEDSTRADFNFTCCAAAGKSGFAWFSSPKAEIGNKATDWTPAPEDIENSVSALETRVTTAESKITADAIVNTVKESSQFQVAGDYVTGTSAYSQLTQTVDGLNSTVQSHTGSILKLQQTAEGIQVRLENQQTIKNLVVNSRLLDGWGYVVSAGASFSKSVSTTAPEFGEVAVARFNASTANGSAQSSYIHMTNAATVTSGKKYTFSMWARKVSGGNARPRFHISPTGQSAIVAENLTTEWKRYSYTFTLGTIEAPGSRSNITTSFGISVLANQTGVFEICCPQLEAGEEMNPWSATSVDVTDYMSFTEDGLVIGDMTEDGLGNNVLIDSDSLDIRNGSDVCGSFSLNDGYAAHASAVECVAMTSGSSLKWPNMCPWKVTLDKSGLNPGDVIKIAGTWTQSINGEIRYSLTLDHYAVIGEAVSGDNIYIGAIGDLATYGFVCLTQSGTANYYPLIPGDISDSRLETDEVKALGEKSLSLVSGDRTSTVVIGDGISVCSSDALNALVSNFRIDASGDKSEIISPDIIKLIHSTSGNSIGFGVGGGGVNRGVYDIVSDKWILYHDANDLILQSRSGQIIANNHLQVRNNGQSDIWLYRDDGYGDCFIYAAGNSDGEMALGVSAEGSTGGGAVRLRIGATYVRPNLNGSIALGQSSYRWGQIYSSKSSISTSDANEKREIKDIDERYDKMFDALIPRTFMYDADDGLKHDRVHTGFVAQEVEQAMTEAGISDMEFAAFCKDVKTETAYEYNENGEESEAKTVKVLDDEGNETYTYGLRYEEFAALNTWQIQRLKARVSELEDTVKRLEALVEDKLGGVTID